MHELIVASSSMLSSPDIQIQALGSLNFRDSVDEQSRDLSSKSFTSLVKTLHEDALTLIHDSSASTKQRILGLNVLDCLLEVKDEDLIRRRRDFGNHLRQVIKNSVNYDVSIIECACKALGHFALIASTTDIEFVQLHFFQPTKDWIKDQKSEIRRVTAVLMLRVLLNSAPALFYSKKEETLSLIWSAINDPKRTIREKAAETLGTFLMFVHQREHDTRFYDISIRNAETGISSSNDIIVHGALLAVFQLLKHPKDLETSASDTKLSSSLASTLKEFMRQKFSSFASIIISKKDATASYIQAGVISLIPALASFDLSSGVFIDTCLADSIDFLITCIKANANHHISFRSLGLLCVTIGQSIPKAMFDNIVSVIFQSLSVADNKQPNTPGSSDAALQALGMIVKSSTVNNIRSQKLLSELVFLVPSMFKSGLTITLIETLVLVCENIDSARGAIQSRLFLEVDMILRSHTNVQSASHFGSTPGNTRSPRHHSSRDKPSTSSGAGMLFSNPFSRPAEITQMLSAALINPKAKPGINFSGNVNSSMSKEEHHSEIVALALHTLHTFDFYTKHPAGAHQVLNSVRECVICCLDDDIPYIRKSATITCCKILERSLDDKQLLMAIRQNSLVSTDTIVLDVLERLLMVGVADDHESIRESVFNAITPRLDPFVARSENLSCLLDVINDESVRVCTAAMTVISRLAYHSPNVIMPQLRKILVQLLRQLEQNEDDRLRENSIILLTELIKGANFLLKPYIDAIVTPLLEQLELPEVDAVAVAALGELSLVSSECIVGHTHILLTKIVKLLDEKGAVKKQEMALKALGQIVSTTGCVITPYLSHPELLDAINNIIQRNDHVSHKVRCEATRAFGILGVADPNKLRVMHRKMLESAQNASRKPASATSSSNQFSTDYFGDPVENAEVDLERKAILWGDTHQMLLESNNQHQHQQHNQLQSAHLNAYHHQPMEHVPTDTEPKKEQRTNGNNLPTHGIFASPMSLGEYNNAITINSLVNILRDPMLRSHHVTAVQITSKVCKYLTSSRSVPMIEELVTCCIDGICNDTNNEIGMDLFRLLRLLIESVQEQIQPFLPRVFEAIESFWYDTQETNALEEVLKLVKSIHNVLSIDSFKTLLPDLLPPMLAVIQEGSDARQEASSRLLLVLNTLARIGPSLGEYIRNVVPVLVRIIDRNDAEAVLRRTCLLVLLHVTKYATDISQFASRMVHILTRLVCRIADDDLQATAMQGLCCMVCRLGVKFVPHVLPIKSALHSASSTEYDNLYHSLVMKAVKDKTLPPEPVFNVPSDWFASTMQPGSGRESTLETRPIDTTGLRDLRAASDVSGRTTSGDWTEWMRRFSLEMLRQSPSPIIHCCKNLAQVYQPLAHELLNAAFLSVWIELDPDQVNVFEISKEAYDLAKAIGDAISAQNIPQTILQDLLNLIEFVELHDRHLPIDMIKVGEQSRKAHAMAKCLRCKELEFSIRPSPACIQALIAVNNQLSLDAAAKGILNHVSKHHPDIKVMPSWQEKLGRWDEALLLYQQQAIEGIEPSEAPRTNGFRRSSSTESAKRFAASVPSLINSHTTFPPGTRFASIAVELECKLGEMRCHSALDNHTTVLKQAKELWVKVSTLNTNEVNDLREDEKRKADDQVQKWFSEVEVLGAKASWVLGEWGDLQKYMSGGRMNSETSEPDDVTAFFGAALAIRDNEFEKAQNFIDASREKIVPMLSSMLGDFSYSRAHRCMVTVQQLSELEEIIQHKRLVRNLRLTHTVENEDAENFSLEQLRKKWDRRLAWVPQETDLWRQILTLRSLVLTPEEDLDAWLKYEKMCRRSGHLSLCHSALKRLGVEDVMINLDSSFSQGERESSIFGIDEALEEARDRTSLLGVNPMHSAVKAKKSSRVSSVSSSGTTVNSKVTDGVNPRVMYSIFKYMWAKDQRTEALSGLHNYCTDLRKLHESDDSSRDDHAITKHITCQLLGRCMLKVAKWKVILQEEKKQSVSFDEIIHLQRQAAELRPAYYKAWHSWALMNYQMIQSGVGGKNKEDVHVVDAAKGFFRSLDLGRNRPMADILQDTLRLLTVWFNNGDREDLNTEMEAGLKTVSVDTWLFVIPQLIARIHTRYPRVNKLLHVLLTKVGKHHPQALIYPVTVASKTSSHPRRVAATAIIAEMRKHDGSLVDEANLVSQEIIRLAITWHEAWHEGLEEASRLFFSENDIEGMLVILEQLHSQLEKASTKNSQSNNTNTVRSVAFHHCYGRDIEEAHEWITSYKATKKMADLHQAWDLYYHIFRRITKQLNNLDKIELQHVSPTLLSQRGLQLAIPGTYKAHSDIVRIQSFATSMDVIVSKQRPRKMSIMGSDGIDYPFLLKGHEDLRQDERVMQLFGLINALLAQDNRSSSNSRNAMSIRTYSVMPLSNNSGVIGWVPECDTLHSLVKQYREPRNIRLNCEHKLMTMYAPNYDTLPLLGKVEVFEMARKETKGEDLSKMLFLRSQNSEIWLGRRTNYTRSVAITSIAGYILGLGDRHPNNLMIDRQTGKVVHIDFGDCWEVCQTRSKFPESIPFRLTRMMTKAMEVSGIEGSFRSDCETVMRILRENRDSLTAMLEAFVHDPLISWRLLTGGNGEDFGDGKKDVGSGERYNEFDRFGDDDDEGSDDDDDDVDDEKDDVLSKLEEEKKRKGKIVRRTSGDNIGNVARRTSLNLLTSVFLAESNGNGKSDNAVDPDAEDTEDIEAAEELNEKAIDVKNRIDEKLNGTDFGGKAALNVSEQVDKLIKTATDVENLCVLFQGWCSFW